MKKFLSLSVAMAALTFASSNAPAKDLVLTVSGSAMVQTTNSENKASVYIGTVKTSSFSNKTIYSLISSAVADAADASGGNISSTSLPADGYIAFDPAGFDGQVEGIFYVTNKEGSTYQLSGFDNNGNYYSWIELDTQSSIYFLGNVLGSGWLNTNIVTGDMVLNAPFNGVVSVNLDGEGSAKPGTGKVTGTSTSLLYIHDDPYAYDDADDPDIFWNNFLDQGGGDDANGQNFNAIEIRGITTATLTYLSFVPTESLSMTGSGNFVMGGNYGSVVKIGKATLK
jgi:hypothetical protein